MAHMLCKKKQQLAGCRTSQLRRMVTGEKGSVTELRLVTYCTLTRIFRHASLEAYSYCRRNNSLKQYCTYIHTYVHKHVQSSLLSLWCHNHWNAAWPTAAMPTSVPHQVHITQLIQPEVVDGCGGSREVILSKSSVDFIHGKRTAA